MTSKIQSFFLVHGHVSRDVFTMIRSVVLHEVANGQTDRQTGKRRLKRSLLGGGSKA